ncbi:MAG: hypothetical protein AAF755_05040 [Pseudomonadota bacterium]
MTFKNMRAIKRFAFGVLSICLIAACAADTSGDSSLEQVALAAYRDPGPPRLTVITVINNRSGSGTHTALMVSGSQQVIFDPAGSFRDPRVVERDDVLYGMTPAWFGGYKAAYARSTHHIVTQEVTVTSQQAEQALRLVQSYGAVPPAHCANSTTNILSQIDGFPPIRVTFFPVTLMEQIAQIPGVKTSRHFEDDEGNILDPVAAAALIAN